MLPLQMLAQGVFRPAHDWRRDSALQRKDGESVIEDLNGNGHFGISSG